MGSEANLGITEGVVEDVCGYGTTPTLKGFVKWVVRNAI